MKSEARINLLAWLLTLAAVIIAFIGWFQGVGGRFSGLDAYAIFPLFGLVAFSIMWSHYLAGFGRRVLGYKQSALQTYFDWTSLAALAAFLLHPAILELSLWRDGVGAPPLNAFKYVGSSGTAAVLLGMIALILFLAYELRRWYRDRSWWWLVASASDLAMILILIHSLKLGSTLQHGWLRGVWIFYAITLGVALGYKYISELRPAKD